MTKFSISEASRLTGKSRQTLYNMIDKGELSAGQDLTGARQLDKSELIRVFGELLSNDLSNGQSKVVQNGHDLTSDLTTKVSLLEQEVFFLNRLLSEKDKLLTEKDSRISLLEYSKPSKAKKDPFWIYLFLTLTSVVGIAVSWAAYREGYRLWFLL